MADECFFIVKQTTAYELRMSDWSSDVCSSDLVELAALAGGADQHNRQAVQLAGDLLGLAPELQVLSLELHPALREHLAVRVRGAQRLLLRQQVVAGEPGLHVHHLAHLAEALDALQQYDFHRPHSSSCRAAAPWAPPAPACCPVRHTIGRAHV